MLNNLENNILNIFISSYELKSNNLIIPSKENLNIIFDNTHLPDKIINIFLKKINDNLNIILENSIYYVIGFETKINYMKYINKLEYYKEDINNLTKINQEFKRDLVTYAIKFLIQKRNFNVDINKVNQIKEKYNTLFEYIKYNYNTKTINQLYREIFNHIKENNQTDIEILLIELLKTNKYDNKIKEYSSNIINNEKELEFYKKYIYKLILSNAYIYEKSVLNGINNVFSVFNNNNELQSPVIEYIENCIEENNFTLPYNDSILTEIITNYNLYDETFDKSQDSSKKLIKDNKNKIKRLNPLYNFD